jgi:hypothetical protein
LPQCWEERQLRHTGFPPTGQKPLASFAPGWQSGVGV